jgi:hypothetical protein
VGSGAGFGGWVIRRIGECLGLAVAAVFLLNVSPAGGIRQSALCGVQCPACAACTGSSAAAADVGVACLWLKKCAGAGRYALASVLVRGYHCSGVVDQVRRSHLSLFVCECVMSFLLHCTALL